MSNPHGSFIWYELITSNADAAGRFYADVVGWTVAAFGGETDYRVFSATDGGVAGMMTIPPDAAQSGMRPGWFGYIGVDDVDAVVADIVAADGRVHMPAFDAPGVGRLAMVADPQGVVFYVMRGTSEQSSTSFDADPDAVGHCGWNELATADPVGALAFYAARFGWSKGDAMSMGDMGDYQFVDHAGDRIGAVMANAPGGSPPMWRFYFRVADIDSAVTRIVAGGGQVIHGPAEVPGDVHVVIAVDPQGAMFALVGRKN